MKTKRLVFREEEKPLSILDRSLKGTPYRVFSKIRLTDVMGTEKGERLSSEEYDFLQTSHLDFVIVEGYDESKSDQEYPIQEGAMLYTHVAVPGIHIPDIASWFCNYLALREIENWAEKNLDRRV